MDDSDLREIKKLMKEIDCPKDFICMKDGYKNLCKAEDLGLDEFLECMQEDSSSCIPFGLGVIFSANAV